MNSWYGVQENNIDPLFYNRMNRLNNHKRIQEYSYEISEFSN